jgi:hypothetical protein
MPDTRITKSRLKNHLHYGKWIYAAIALAAFFVVELVYTTTEYRPDAYHRVDIYLVGQSAPDETGLEPVAQEALEAGFAYDERMEAVNFMSIHYSGDAETDIYGAQKYMVILAAGEADCFFVNQRLFEQLIIQGGALPLDEYIASGVLPADKAVRGNETDSDGNPTGREFVYGIRLDGLGRMLSDEIGYDSRDKIAVILAASVNPDTTAVVINSVMDQLSGDAPASAPIAASAAGDAAAADAASAGNH